MKTHRIATVVLPLALLLGCGKAERAAEPMEAAPAATAADARAEAAPPGIQGRAKAPVDRKLVQNAELRIEVEAYAEARAAIDRQLSEVGGFVADARVEHRDGEVSQATLKLRIPQDKLDEFLTGAAGSGKVLHEALRSEDVTDAYYDTQARLNNARRLEGRLLELMAQKTDGVQALLEVERELARVREEIERMQGQLLLMDDKVSLATVELQLLAKHTYVAATPPSFGERVTSALAGSFGGLVKLADWMVIAAVALLPWLPVIALLIFVCRRLVRLADRKIAPKLPAPQPPAAA